MNLVLNPENNNFYFGDILISIGKIFKNISEIQNTIVFIEEIEEFQKLNAFKFKNVVFFVFTKDKIDKFNLKEYKIFGDSYIFFIEDISLIKKYKNYNQDSVLYSSFLLAENLRDFMDENKNNVKFYIPKILNNKEEVRFIF